MHLVLTSFTISVCEGELQMCSYDPVPRSIDIDEVVGNALFDQETPSGKRVKVLTANLKYRWYTEKHEVRK